ncbi:hypothetical protein PHYPSEUDO_003976 [Phytophthora pseudosyringae]|uniref:Transmembrane protein n=1 Tax=Phytophthora pseudosyringae TaxID=221518 RepID=A0A8T1VP57_9STRA|nr:hypothetical protein PHYPSEUDO_003976 [Phytophthora pseudosyringae]
MLVAKRRHPLMSTACNCSKCNSLVPVACQIRIRIHHPNVMYTLAPTFFFTDPLRQPPDDQGGDISRCGVARARERVVTDVWVTAVVVPGVSSWELVWRSVLVVLSVGVAFCAVLAVVVLDVSSRELAWHSVTQVFIL